jgi:hypothetical protein
VSRVGNDEHEQALELEVRERGPSQCNVADVGRVEDPSEDPERG